MPANFPATAATSKRPATTKTAGPPTVQLVRKPVLKSVRLTNVGLLEQVRAYPVFGILIDSYRKGSFGGTGERFDWTLLRGLELEKPLIVAGGLTPENVADAVRQMRPYAVDVATGVENREGFKDRFKMRDFVVAARVQDQASKEQKNFDGTLGPLKSKAREVEQKGARITKREE